MNTAIFILSVSLLIWEVQAKAKMDYLTRSKLAQDHYERVLLKMTCKTPQPRVTRVENHKYKLVPAATVLHRCGDSTGCCDNPDQMCVAKTKEKVKLYFFARSLDLRGWKRTRHYRVKKLSFTNHTECHCVNRINKPR